MRLGKVQIISGYVVDLDNDVMVQHAKDALYDDFDNAIRNPDEFYFMIDYDKDSEKFNQSDIPEFLKTEEDEG